MKDQKVLDLLEINKTKFCISVSMLVNNLYYNTMNEQILMLFLKKMLSLTKHSHLYMCNDLIGIKWVCYPLHNSYHHHQQNHCSHSTVTIVSPHNLNVFKSDFNAMVGSSGSTHQSFYCQ